jgi:photosystem II stability/assembly factor-like uncharacterized protein
MPKGSYTILLLIVLLLADIQVNAQWQIVTHLPKKPTKTLNVDVPPSIDMRPPIIWSISFADDRNGWAACDDGTLLQTSDGGNKWVRRIIYPRVNTITPSFVDSIGVFFNNNRKGWIVAHLQRSAVILVTENGGQSWKVRFRVPFKLSTLANIWFANEKYGWAVGEAEDNGVDGGIIYGTRDGGKTWILQYKGSDQESFVDDVRFSDTLNGWAVGDEAVFHTTDGGTTWQRQNLPKAAYFFGVDVISSNEAWVVGSNGSILHTTDRGSSWNQFKLPSEYEDHWLNSVKFINSNHGWVAGNDGAIFFTNDGGKTWQLESKDTSSYLRGLAVAGNHIFAFGNDGVILRRAS